MTSMALSQAFFALAAASRSSADSDSSAAALLSESRFSAAFFLKVALLRMEALRLGKSFLDISKCSCSAPFFFAVDAPDMSPIWNDLRSSSLSADMRPLYIKGSRGSKMKSSAKNARTWYLCYSEEKVASAEDY